MRIRILSCAVALLFGAVPGFASAQGAAPAPVRDRFGVIIGVASSTIAGLPEAEVLTPESSPFGDFSASTSRRTGLDAGIFARVPLRGAFSLQPEVHYVQRGVTSRVRFNFGELPDGVSGDFDVSSTTKIDYLEVPLLLRFDSGRPTSRWRLLLAGGPTLAVRVSCKSEISLAGATLSEGCDNTTTTNPNGDDGEPVTLNTEASPRRFDAGGVVSGGVTTALAGHAFTLQARYQLGFVSITNPDLADAPSAHNRGVSLLLSVGF